MRHLWSRMFRRRRQGVQSMMKHLRKIHRGNTFETTTTTGIQINRRVVNTSLYGHSVRKHAEYTHSCPKCAWPTCSRIVPVGLAVLILLGRPGVCRPSCHQGVSVTIFATFIIPCIVQCIKTIMRELVHISRTNNEIIARKYQNAGF